MKKLLLSMAAAALTASASWASQTTLSFEGDTDLYGLTRYTTTVQSDLTFVQEVSHSQDGVDFKISNTLESKTGFALINAGETKSNGEQNGLAVYCAGFFASSGTWVSPDISITVPGGKISEVKLNISGAATYSMEIFVGEGDSTVLPDPTQLGTGYYCYTWQAKSSQDDDGTVETLNLHWAGASYVRYIHSIEVTYTADLGGKEECGLSFSTSSAEGFVGEEFKVPVLRNPNNLPIIWSSSNEAVATVDDSGNVTLAGKGKAYIVAATEGNDNFAAGNARYELTVFPVANSIAEMMEFAPANGDKVKVNCPLTATYVSSPSIYVVDDEYGACVITDDARLQQNETVYKIGDIIPEGWIATFAGVDGFTGKLANPTETGFVNYQEVTSVTKADANRVVVLQNVTFSTSTPTGDDPKTGTTPDGETYEFRNTFNAPEMPAGTYDVTCVVKYNVIGSREYFYLVPISYFEYPEKPSTIELTANSETVKVEKMASEYEEEGMYSFQVSGSSSEKEVTLTFAVPEGFSGFVGGFQEGGSDTGNLAAKAKKVRTESYDWMPLDWMMEEGMEKGNEFKVPADGKEYMGSFILYKDDKAYMGIYIMVNAKISNEASAPVFPEEFVVAVSDENIDVQQINDVEEAMEYYIILTGEIEGDSYTLDIETPEGWDGFYGAVTGDEEAEEGGDDATIFARKRARMASVTDDEEMWMPIDELTAGMPLKPTNKLTFKIGAADSYGILFLYKGDKALYVPIMINPAVTKVETEDPAPVFPEEFVVAVSDENIDVQQINDVEEAMEYYIILTGEIEGDSYTLDIETPEGWDGFYGAVTGDEEAEEGGDDATIFARKRARMASVTDDEEMWMPIDELTAGMPLKPTNKLTFKIGAADSYGILFLYKGDKALYVPIMINPAVTKVETEDPAPVFPEEFEITLSDPNIDNAQMNDPEEGRYYVILSGKTNENFLTIKLETPAGWDGFYGAVMDNESPAANRKAARAIAEEEEMMWVPVEELIASGMPLEKTNELTINLNAPDAMGVLFLYKGEMALYKPISIISSIETGISSIEAADKDARYFNLQGVEVKNPESGVYVKVSNGKAVKVTRK